MSGGGNSRGGGRRAAALVMAVLVVATVLGLFVHRPAPVQPDQPAFLGPPDGRLPPPTSGPYTATARLETYRPGAERQAVWTRTYAPGETPVVKEAVTLAGEEGPVQRVTYRRGRREYVRATFSERETFERRLGSNVVRTDRSALTYYRVEPAAAPPAAAIEPPSQLRPLWLFTYDRRGTTSYRGELVVRYVPTPGWTVTDPAGPGERSQYVRAASGEVLVAPETGAILKADVSGRIVPASNWAEATVRRGYAVSLKYRVTAGADRPAEPPWVQGLQETPDVRDG